MLVTCVVRPRFGPILPSLWGELAGEVLTCRLVYTKDLVSGVTLSSELGHPCIIMLSSHEG